MPPMDFQSQHFTDSSTSMLNATPFIIAAYVLPQTSMLNPTLFIIATYVLSQREGQRKCDMHNGKFFSHKKQSFTFLGKWMQL